MRSGNRTTRVFGIPIAAGCPAPFAAYGLAEALFRSRESRRLLQYAAAFGCFGFMCSTILAYHAEAGDRYEDFA